MSHSDLPFDAPGAQSGYERWQEDRRAARCELARRLGLPLGHQVEIWLRGEIRLRGRLNLAEEQLFLPEKEYPQIQLAVGRATFTAAEIESCVRTD
jgi:hypothetical protein